MSQNNGYIVQNSFCMKKFLLALAVTFPVLVSFGQTISPACNDPQMKVTYIYGNNPWDTNGSSTQNAYASITLGNKGVVADDTFFNLFDRGVAYDDGTIVSSGLQNFAVSRHPGYVEFLALGRRVAGTTYGYYE